MDELPVGEINHTWMVSLSLLWASKTVLVMEKRLLYSLDSM